MYFFDPLEQFSIFILFPLFFGNLDLSVTNFTLFCLILIASVYLVYNHGLSNAKLVAYPFQSLVEVIFDFVFNLVKGSFNTTLTNKYLPFLMTVFLFILFSNLLGMVPYSFTITSHLIVTLVLALIIFTYFTLIGLVKHKKQFFAHFFPEGSPLWLAPLLVIIEFISYTVRVVSLSVRLFANMMSGHTLFKILATFGWILLNTKGVLFFLSIAPILILFLLTGLELGVACLQAYVFTVLTIIYIEEVYSHGH